MWVRGLKLVIKMARVLIIMSHPMWVRGLKLQLLPKLFGCTGVAPHVGAWIETITSASCASTLTSRTPCGCVD